MVEAHKIAVVDDDARILESLENLFQSGGYATRPFPSGAKLLESGLGDIDCLVTDIGMPGMDGFELLERVKQLRPDLPVLLITGRHEIGDRQKAATVDIRGLFQKPFDGPTLLAAVAEALQSQRVVWDHDYSTTNDGDLRRR